MPLSKITKWSLEVEVEVVKANRGTRRRDRESRKGWRQQFCR